jgi:glycosyltransferase involved in cell wall biosynthesis
VKIVFIEFAGKGGMIHYAFQLCRALAASGADVTLVTENVYELADLPHNFIVDRSIELWDPKPQGRLSTSKLAILGRKLRRVTRAFRHYGEWLRLIRRIGAMKPDVILLGDIRFPFDLFPLMLLSRKSRVFADICHNVHPFTTGGKAAGLFNRSSWTRAFYRRIYHLFDVVFVHFDRNVNEFTSSFGVPREKVGVIVHSNEAIFAELRAPGVTAAALRDRLHLGGSEPVVLFFGTLSRYKGVDVLLNAFAHVRRTSAAKLVLAGYPSADFDLAAHQQLAKSLGIDGDVVWVPEYIDSREIVAWMELASVIVFPYRDIYQSGAIHVAQTFGVPIIASAVGAMQDVIENEVSGLLVPPENAEALAAAITRLLADRPLAQRLGARAAEDARGPFSWETTAGKILSALQHAG